MQKLIIDRSKWLHAEGSKNSCLLRTADNKMCCLGFYLKSLGVPTSNIEGVTMPVTERLMELLLASSGSWLLRRVYDEYTKNTLHTTSIDCQELACLNDSVYWSDPKTQEKKITKIFATHDVEVVFVDRSKI